MPPHIPRGTGELTTTENYPAQEGNSAEVGKPLFSNVSPTATGTLWMLFVITVLGNGAWSGKCSIHIPSRCEYSFNLSYLHFPFSTRHSKLQSENRQLILSQNFTSLICCCFTILPAKSSTIKCSASTKPSVANTFPCKDLP